MLCPEVWNFQPPESIFEEKKLSLKQCSNIINSFQYNHLISVIIPNSSKIPTDLINELKNDTDYYRIEDLKVVELIKSDFIDNFIKKGTLYLLSIDRRLDCDNTLAVTPNGHLILNLDKATYQSLGIAGTVSNFHKETSSRYVVQIDLKSTHFKPGKANYEKTKHQFEKFNESFRVVLSWEPPDECTCPSSIAKYFDECGFALKTCTIKDDAKVVFNTEIPLLDENELDVFVEWLGVITVDANNFQFNNYEVPKPNLSSDLVTFTFMGLFTGKKIKQIIQQIRNYQIETKTDWTSIYVQGYSDSPIAWNHIENHFYTNSDNGYILIRNVNDKKTIVCVEKCTQKKYKTKRKNALY